MQHFLGHVQEVTEVFIDTRIDIFKKELAVVGVGVVSSRFWYHRRAILLCTSYVKFYFRSVVIEWWKEDFFEIREKKVVLAQVLSPDNRLSVFPLLKMLGVSGNDSKLNKKS
jgi:hypothetical protein